MSVGSMLRSSYLRYFSKPASERTLYQAITARSVHSIVEIGIDLTARTPRLLEVAGWKQDAASLAYTGIDQFEARPAHQPRLSLKQAHAALAKSAAHVRLVPGDPAMALARAANSLAATDLLIISSLADPQSLLQAWRWVPRMLVDSSLVIVQRSTDTAASAWQVVSPEEIQRLALSASKARRAA